MERITRQNLEDRVSNVNRRMEQRGSRYRYQVQGRNGYIGLDRFARDPNSTLNLPDSVPGRGAGWMLLSTVTVGTKREVAEFLHAMMVGIDDAAIAEDVSPRDLLRHHVTGAIERGEGEAIVEQTS